MKSEKCKKHLKKIISFLTVICCLAGSLFTVNAASSESGSGGIISANGNRVVFENEEEPIPILRVTKSLQPGGTAPEGANPEIDTFTFTLEVQKTEGGEWEIMSEEEYTKYDKDGNQVNQEDGTTFFKTSYFGKFTLRIGQTAQFDFLQSGWNYRVTEEKKDSYSLKSIKKNGNVVEAARGKMPAGMERIEMINGYKGSGHLQVTKEVVFATGYTAPESPVFRYKLVFPTEQAKVKYAYTLYRKTVTGDMEEIETGLTTDEEGYFTLLGGQTAIFQDIPANAVYQVEELGLADVSENEARKDDESGDWRENDWWLVGGQPKREGLVSEAEEEIFKNVNVSFAVSKRLNDYSELPETRPEGMSEEEYEKEKAKMTFTFLLTDGDKGIGEARYYLYHNLQSYSEKRGTQVDNAIHKTDSEGYFTLLPGQTAIFIGMMPGSAYKVREVASQNLYYKQITPEDPEGYAVRKVDNSPEVLEFVNEPTPPGLRIKKDLVNYKGEEPPDNEAEFIFILEKKVETNSGSAGENSSGGGQPEAEEYEPLPNALFTVGGNSFKTDSKGRFTLKAYQEALFEALEIGAVYRVGEVIGEEGYNSVEYEFSKWLTVSDGESQGSSSGTEGSDADADDSRGIAETKADESNGTVTYYSKGLKFEARKNITFACVNNYVPDKLDLELVKVDPDHNPLSGAIFKLYREENKDSIVVNPDTEEGSFTTPENGTITIHGLKAGTYILEEVKAPSGYCLLSQPVTIVINRKGSEVEITIGNETVKGAKLVTEEGADMKNEDFPNVKVTLNPEGNDRVVLTVCNNKLYELPSSGGMGIYWYMIGGVLLMMAASLILYRKNHMGEVLKD